MKDFVTKEYYDDHIYIKFFVQHEATQRMAGVIENMYPEVTVNGFVWEEIFKTYYETNNIFDFAIVEYSSTSNYVESCQETVPEAITAFLEGTDFIDVIRTAVSLGGDCDTLTDIAAAMGEAYYGCPGDMMEECEKRIEEEMAKILGRFVLAARNKYPSTNN